MQLGKKTIISHKKRSFFYNEVCNNKLFDCHHSDSDSICFMHECKKRGCKLLVQQQHLLVNERFKVARLKKVPIHAYTLSTRSQTCTHLLTM